MEWRNFSRICVPVPQYVHHIVGDRVAWCWYGGTLNPLQIRFKGGGKQERKQKKSREGKVR